MSEENQILIGRLGRNPELYYTTKGVALCKLSLALEEKLEGQTIWKSVLVWQRLAEVCKVHLRKGNQVFVRGRKCLREYKSQEGEIKIIEEFWASFVAVSLI